MKDFFVPFYFMNHYQMQSILLSLGDNGGEVIVTLSAYLQILQLSYCFVNGLWRGFMKETYNKIDAKLCLSPVHPIESVFPGGASPRRANHAEFNATAPYSTVKHV